LESGLISRIAEGPVKPFPAVLGVSGSTAFHTADDDKVRQWDAATGRARREFDSAGQLGLGRPPAAMSPHGQRVVLLGSKWIVQGQLGHFNSTQILFYDAATGEVARRWIAIDARFESAAWSADGRYLLLAGVPSRGGQLDGLEDALPIAATSSLVLFDGSTGMPLRSVDPVEQSHGRPLTMTALAFSPDGNFFAIAQIDGSIHVYDVISGRVCRSFRGHRN